MPHPAPFPGYAELHARSNFSFLVGASHPRELVAEARRLRYLALAITDECSLAGVVHAWEAARECGLPLITGSEFALDADPAAPPVVIAEEARFGPPLPLPPLAPRLVVLARTRAGYAHLSELISLARMRAPKGDYALTVADLEGRTPGFEHLRGLPDCLVLMLPSVRGTTRDAARRLLAEACWARDLFGADRVWLVAERHYWGEERPHLRSLLWVSAWSGLRITAAGGVLMHHRARKPLQDTLTAIRHGLALPSCGWRLLPNSENHLRPLRRLRVIYRPEWMDESVRIASMCSFDLGELRYEYPTEIVPPGRTPASHLARLALRGAQRRYPRGLPEKVRGLLRHELSLIAELRYEAFFLTIEDIVRFARSRGILCQGRGSAANSAVCFCLGITEVDPDTASLLFERFISRERGEPPDIDVDFEHQRREEVIQYVYAKYGRDRAALAATVIRYRPRSALRDVGKALELDGELMEEVIKSHAWWDGREIRTESLRAAGFDLDSPRVQHWIRLTRELVGFPRHLSQHVGGFVISAGKLTQLVPVENASMDGRSVIQWDKDDLDALGLLKVDVLALGMLTAIRRTLEQLSADPARRAAVRGLGAALSHGSGERRAAPLPVPAAPEADAPDPAPLSMADIPRDCPRTWEMLGRADTVGVFQVESRAQMSMLPRLRPECFYDLVVEVAIVRPGPIVGGMVHPYLRRKQGLEPVEIPHPDLEPALARTLGVPVFQEQVMQVAMLAAGFTAGEADELRRSMAAWRRKGGIDRFRDRLIGGMLARGYARDFAEAIYRQAEGFGEYGFPESHAASFAKLTWVSSWLKCHFPDAFLVALLNSQPMGFYAPAQLVQDAQRHGVEVRGVDVLASDWESRLESGTDADAPPVGALADGASGRAGAALALQPFRPVRLGLHLVSGLSEPVARRIAEVRAGLLARGANFDSVEDLGRRCGLDRDKRSLKLLAEAGALATLAGNRRQARWQAEGVHPLPGMLRDTRRNEAPVAIPAPGEGADIASDYRMLGLTLGRHPLALLRDRLGALRFRSATELARCRPGQVARGCGLVIGRQRPGTARGTMFVTLEDETGPVNVIVRPDLVERQRDELLTARLLGVIGTWQCDGEVKHLVAGRVEDLSALLGQLAPKSRDFH
ncbi:error-prone DNA polymerase [Derxia gummosa]|uniref:Error-prone DNA polymerase n=1 Tax=Derxia gummosa DSM 723 TaxID=1121388 RepID=A0A8B6X3B1_9BURK|nr:error-prone DNA polymerase [Derxia gummosa]